jgi:hypothetical protein
VDAVLDNFKVDIVECSDGEGVFAIKSWIEQRRLKAPLPLIYTFRSEQLLTGDALYSAMVKQGEDVDTEKRKHKLQWNPVYRKETKRLATHYIGVMVVGRRNYSSGRTGERWTWIGSMMSSLAC